MYVDCYVMEVMAKTRLAELRSDAARRRALASLRAPRPGIWAILRSWLHREEPRSSGKKMVTARHA